ncbi:MAG: VWA domain-containing protein, partial [Acidobacteriota bacterium]
SVPGINRVLFYLDDVEVASDGRPPFTARLDFADPPRLQTVRAVALDRNGLTVGEDALEVNARDRPFRVTIDALTVAGDGALNVEATVGVPADGALRAVTVDRGGPVLETRSAPPFRFRLAPDTRPASPAGDAAAALDYVRVAAALTDGRTIDTVAVVGAPLIDDVEVNLASVHAVVVGADGTPLRDLPRDAFTLRRDGKPVAIASVAGADDVPLAMGLVIDSSGSMTLLLPITQRAAIGFLGNVLRDGDRAFVADFADRPRLRRGWTLELPTLLSGLNGLDARGATALYDALTFSLLQFDAASDGRRALVVLTDGDDRDSRFGPKDVIRAARRAGVAVYLIGLGALDGFARNLPERQLRRITRETGGRLFLVEEETALTAAYDQIRAELRNQWTLTFYVEDDLDDADFDALTVEVDRPDATVRTVVRP